MVITDKKYLDNSGLIKTLDNLNEQFNGIRLKKFLDVTKSAANLFSEYEGTSVDNLIKYDDTSNVTNMSYMFYECTNLTTIPLLDTSKVTDMSYMFRDCPSLTTIPALDTSKVTDMGYMFRNCRNLTTIPLLDTSKVYNMTYMFRGCRSLTTIPQLDTSNVTNMYNMFYDCTNIEQIHMTNINADLTISDCTKMEKDAIVEVLNNLKDLTGSTGKTLRLGSTLLAKLTEEDKLIATNKNWTLA